MRPLVLATVLAALALTPAARADSWMPYGRKRIVDGRGEHYVVISGEMLSTATFTYARRKDGTPAVKPEAAQWARYDTDPRARLREGDPVLARGTLAQTPYEVLVSSRGHGFVCLERYGQLGYGKSVVIVSAKGRVLHELTLADLVGADAIEGYTHTVSSIWWLGPSWIDEEARELVVVDTRSRLFVVSMEKGTVRRGGDEEIRRAVLHDDPEVVNDALQLAEKHAVTGLEATYAALVLDDTKPLGARLRAGVALGTQDQNVQALFRRAAERPLLDEVTEDDREYALAHLGAVLGEDALPVLRDALRGEADHGWHSAQQGLVAMGPRAVPTLIAILRDEGSNDYRGGAAHALKRMPRDVAAPALDALLETIADAPEYVANAAANAAIAHGGERIAGRLAAILAAGSTQDGRLAMYFERVRHPAAEAALLKALDRALARGDADDFDVRRIRDALAFQRQ